MSWSKALADLRRQLSLEIERGITRLVGFTLVSASSSIGDGDSVETDDGATGSRPVQRIEPFGFRSRPPGKVRGLWIRLGSSNVAFIGVMPSGKYGPQDLAEGESAQFCSAAGAVNKLDKDGKNTIDAAAGQDVVVNGGSKKVARVDDTLTASVVMATWAKAVEDAIQAAGLTVPVPPFSTGAGAASAFGKIATGAARFKG